MQDFRKIKAQTAIVKNKYSKKKVPQLLLKGEWLKAAGFDAGNSCSIKVENGRLTILSI